MGSRPTVVGSWTDRQRGWMSRAEGSRSTLHRNLLRRGDAESSLLGSQISLRALWVVESVGQSRWEDALPSEGGGHSL